MALRCEECQYTKFYKSDKKPLEGRRWWRCGRCGHIQLGYRMMERQEPRELYIDIETSPNQGIFYDLKVNGYLNPEMITKDWYILAWSAEWMNCYGHKNHAMALTPKEAKAGDDKRIMLPLRALLNEADLVWGHNYKRFDRRKINTRLIVHGIPAPEPYKMVDTLQVARKEFAFASNRLDEINKRLGLGQKDDVGLDDWKACMAGDKKALDKILKYNIRDVKNGIAMTKKFREWIIPFPNISKYVRQD